MCFFALLSRPHAWEEYKGRERVIVLGKAVAECLPPDEVKVHQSANKQLLRWGGRTLVETQVRHGDGSRRDTRLDKAAIADEHGQVTGVLTILMDVSEFREAERATQEARDAAEEASRAKSEFVANMSHELRTPLQYILGFAELGMLRGRTQPKLAGMFEGIHSAGQRMLMLVNDLLEVSKLESTVGTFHMERIDLRGVVRPVIRELEPLLERSHLMMDLRMPDLPLVAKADPLRFQQVIRNVVASSLRLKAPSRWRATLTPRARRTWWCATKARAFLRQSCRVFLKPLCSPAKPRMDRAVRAWAWPFAARSSRPWGGGSLPRTYPPAAPRSTSSFLPEARRKPCPHRWNEQGE